MNVTRFDPWNWVSVLNGDPRRALAYSRAAGNTGTPIDWVPAVDIVEEKDRFVLRADLPGVSADDIDVDMEKNVLSIAGKRVSETLDESDTLQLSERASGEFRRRFTLPEAVDADGINARYDRGTLEVSIPKQTVATTRRIEVKAA